MFGFGKKKQIEPLCPKFKVPCLEHGCTHYQKFRGENPQNGEKIDDYACADLWGNVLAIENSKLILELGASVDQLRIETGKAYAELIQIASQEKALLTQERESKVITFPQENKP